MFYLREFRFFAEFDLTGLTCCQVKSSLNLLCNDYNTYFKQMFNFLLRVD